MEFSNDNKSSKYILEKKYHYTTANINSKMHNITITSHFYDDNTSHCSIGIESDFSDIYHFIIYYFPRNNKNCTSDENYNIDDSDTYLFGDDNFSEGKKRFNLEKFYHVDDYKKFILFMIIFVFHFVCKTNIYLLIPAIFSYHMSSYFLVISYFLGNFIPKNVKHKNLIIVILFLTSCYYFTVIFTKIFSMMSIWAVIYFIQGMKID